jgi:hypothetical protein
MAEARPVARGDEIANENFHMKSESGVREMKVK